MPVSIDIGFLDHFVDLLISEFFAQVGHDVPQFGCGDESVTISIEDLEGFNELLLGVSVLHLPGHQGEELGEIDGSVSVGINLGAVVVNGETQDPAVKTVGEMMRIIRSQEIPSQLMEILGAFGVALVGDPHVDDPGTDIRLLQSHVALFQQHDRLLPIGIGDYHNNWIGRLARLYAEQSTSAAEALVLVEWLVRSTRWLALVGGNHDLWSGAGDPIQWMARQARVQYEAHGVRLGLHQIGRAHV